jgi:hypothetical protein
LSIISELLEKQNTILRRASKPQHTDLRSLKHCVKMKFASARFNANAAIRITQCIQACPSFSHELTDSSH